MLLLLWIENIWYVGYLTCDPQRGHDPQAENRYCKVIFGIRPTQCNISTWNTSTSRASPHLQGPYHSPHLSLLLSAQSVSQSFPRLPLRLWVRTDQPSDIAGYATANSPHAQEQILEADINKYFSRRRPELEVPQQSLGEAQYLYSEGQRQESEPWRRRAMLHWRAISGEMAG